MPWNSPGGELVGCSVCLWTTGFWASPLAADAGLALAERGASSWTRRHAQYQTRGSSLSVIPQLPTGLGSDSRDVPERHAVGSARDPPPQGKAAKPFRFEYFHQPVSLGRGDAVIQFTKPDDSPRRWYLTGRQGGRYTRHPAAPVPGISGPRRSPQLGQPSPSAKSSRVGGRRSTPVLGGCWMIGAPSAGQPSSALNCAGIVASTWNSTRSARYRSRANSKHRPAAS